MFAANTATPPATATNTPANSTPSQGACRPVATTTNPRCEQFEMTDDKDRARLFLDFADALWAELPPGDTEDRKLPSPYSDSVSLRFP